MNIAREELRCRRISFVDKSTYFPPGEEEPVLVGEEDATKSDNQRLEDLRCPKCSGNLKKESYI